MEKQNITLSLPKDLLAKVKHLAIDENYFGLWVTSTISRRIGL